MMSSLYLFFQHLLFCIFFYSVFSRWSHRSRENEKRNNFLARSSREIEPRLTGISSIYLFFSTLLFCIFFYLVVRIIDAERKRKRNNFLAMSTSFFLYFLSFYSLFFYSVFSRSNHRCREKDKGREIISRNRAKINRDFFFYFVWSFIRIMQIEAERKEKDPCSRFVAKISKIRRDWRRIILPLCLSLFFISFRSIDLEEREWKVGKILIEKYFERSLSEKEKGRERERKYYTTSFLS